jgi:STE24 endopeptidase
LDTFTLTALFVLLITSVTLARLWLARRQIAHVIGHRDHVPPAFASVISAEAHAKAADYTVAKVRHGMQDLLLGTGVLLVLTLGGGISWLDAQLATVLGDGLLHGLALIGAAMLVSGLAELPLAWKRVFGLEASFGFNRMSRGLFIRDLLLKAGMSVAIGAPIMALVLWIMQAMGEYWWFYAWSVWAAFNFAVMALYPTVVAPLFNTFSRLPEGELKQRIETLLARCGFASGGLFTMDSSRRSSHGNAYFSGFGAAKRIVLFDTLISRLTPVEVEAVLAHELGHFKRQHVRRRLVLMFGIALAVFALMGWVLQSPVVFEALGLGRPTTAGGILLIILTVPYLLFVLRPLLASYSRKHEFEADAYAAEHADADALVDALVKLYKDNASTLTPDPLHSAVYDSHPPAAQRIARLREFAPGSLPVAGAA